MLYCVHDFLLIFEYFLAYSKWKWKLMYGAGTQIQVWGQLHTAHRRVQCTNVHTFWDKNISMLAAPLSRWQATPQQIAQLNQRIFKKFIYKFQIIRMAINHTHQRDFNTSPTDTVNIELEWSCQTSIWHSIRSVCVNVNRSSGKSFTHTQNR